MHISSQHTFMITFQEPTPRKVARIKTPNASKDVSKMTKVHVPSELLLRQILLLFDAKTATYDIWLWFLFSYPWFRDTFSI